MKNYFIDMWRMLIKPAFEFYKKHWLGEIILNAVLIGGELIWFNWDRIHSYFIERYKPIVINMTKKE